MLTGCDMVFAVDIPQFQDIIVATAGEKRAVWGKGDGINGIIVTTQRY